MSPPFIGEKINLLKDIEGEKGLQKFLVLKKNYRMMGNSVSRYVSAVKTVKPQKFTLHQLSFFSSLQRSQTLPLPVSSCLDHCFNLAFFRLIWILFPFKITPTSPIYVFPLTFLSIFVFFFVLLQT